MSSVRGVQVLEVLAGMHQPASLASVAERTGMSQSQAYRTLDTLARHGYVDHIGRSGYRLGSRSVALAALIGPRPQLLRIVYPTLTRLAAAAHESVLVHLRAGSDRVLLLALPGPRGPHRDSLVLGERSPLARGCSGRVILAHLPAEERANMPFAAVSERRLKAIRERGFETSYAENHVDVNGVAAAIVTDEGVAIGSMTIAGPSARLPEDLLLAKAGILCRACENLSPQLSQLLGPNASSVLDALDVEPVRTTSARRRSAVDTDLWALTHG